MIDPKILGKIGVLAGGPSNEREISLRSGEAVFEALRAEGCDVIFLDVADSACDIIKRSEIDVAFIALHGRFGEDGTVQSILEEEKIPYTGSGVTASRLALDKIASREIFKKHNIPTPDYIVLEKDTDSAAIDTMAFPVVVKPRSEGSSIGLSVVREKQKLTSALELAFQYGTKIIVEQYIQGRELTVGILGNSPLPVIEIVARGKVYDYNAKYKDPETRYVTPAQVEEHVYRRAQDLGILAHQSIGCRSFSRVDMMYDAKDDIRVLEVNSIPGMTERSLLPKAAQAAGISFKKLCLQLVEMAYHGRKKS